MPRVGSTFKYKVKYVRHFQTKNGTATSFSISEKISGSMPTQYQSYSFVVWDNLDIIDGDSVNILSIDSIKVNGRNGKLYVNLSGTVQVLKSDTAQYAEEQPPAFVPQAEPPKNDDGSDPWKLPFDI